MHACVQDRKEMFRAVRMEHEKGDLQYDRNHPGAGAAGKGDQAVSGAGLSMTRAQMATCTVASWCRPSGQP